MSQNLSSAPVVIGALRVNVHEVLSLSFHTSLTDKKQTAGDTPFV